jgi:hypothetical protein
MCRCEQNPVKIERLKPLPDAGEQAIRITVVAQVEANPKYYLSEYLRRFGNVLNADNAATLFPEYNADPAAYRAAVHPGHGMNSYGQGIYA